MARNSHHTPSIVSPRAIASSLREWADASACPTWADAFDDSIDTDVARGIIRAAGQIEQHISPEDPRLNDLNPYAFVHAVGSDPVLTVPGPVAEYLATASPDWSARRWFKGLHAAYRRSPALTADEVAAAQEYIDRAREMAAAGLRPIRAVNEDGQPVHRFVCDIEGR